MFDCVTGQMIFLMVATPVFIRPLMIGHAILGTLFSANSTSGPAPKKQFNDGLLPSGKLT
jgi:hypothetical protein